MVVININITNLVILNSLVQRYENALENLKTADMHIEIAPHQAGCSSIRQLGELVSDKS